MKKGNNQMIDTLLSPYLNKMDFSKCQTERELMNEIQKKLSLEDMISIEQKLNENGKSIFITDESFPRRFYEKKMEEIVRLRETLESISEKTSSSNKKSQTSISQSSQEIKEQILKNIQYIVYGCGIRSYMKEFCVDLKIHELLLSLWHNDNKNNKNKNNKSNESSSQQQQLKKNILQLREKNMCVLALSELCESPEIRQIFLEGDIIKMFRNDFIKFHKESFDSNNSNNKKKNYTKKKKKNKKKKKPEEEEEVEGEGEEEEEKEKKETIEALYYIGKLFTDISMQNNEAKHRIFRDSEILQCFVSQIIDLPLTVRGISSFHNSISSSSSSSKNDLNDIFEIDCHVNLCFNALRFFSGCNKKVLVQYKVFNEIHQKTSGVLEQAKENVLRSHHPQSSSSSKSDNDTQQKLSQTANQNVVYYSKSVLKMLSSSRKNVIKKRVGSRSNSPQLKNTKKSSGNTNVTTTTTTTSSSSQQQTQQQKQEQSQQQKPEESFSGIAVCGFCKRKEGEKEKFKVCGRCKGEYYCSVDHQKRHWKEHKKYCRSK